MILPILSYGHSMLRKKCENIDKDFPALETIIENMWQTMRGANGCGLAAPQVDIPIRLFLVDSKAAYDVMDIDYRNDYFEGDEGIKETFINAQVIEKSDKMWVDGEGCLSIPTLEEDVKRHWSITIEYFDRGFNKQTKRFSGATSRMIQHEFDHTEGILYLDYLNPLTRRLLQGKLKKIVRGQFKAKYPMKFIK